MALTEVTIAKILMVDGELPPPPIILASRADLGKVRIKKSPVRSYLPGCHFLEAVLSYDSEGLGPEDFLIQCVGNRNVPLAGAIPENMFGLLWGKWVGNPTVQVSAINHILSKKPAASGLVFLALSPMCPEDALDSWMAVARTMLIDEKVSLLWERTTKGRAFFSAGQVKAMPIRIAQFSGGWKPPIPRPKYNANKVVTTVKLPVEEQ